MTCRATGTAIEGQYGNHDTMRVKGMLNIPLGDTLAVRLAGISLQRDGYTKNLVTDNDIDDRDQYKPGFKFNDWELKGVPLRIEINDQRSPTFGRVHCRQIAGDRRLADASLSIEDNPSHLNLASVVLAR